MISTTLWKQESTVGRFLIKTEAHPKREVGISQYLTIGGAGGD